MNLALRSTLAAQMLAYVDDCLPQKDRKALEERMAEDPKVRSEIALWLAQNAAIRAAFSERPAPNLGGRPASPFQSRAPRADAANREDKQPERGPRAIVATSYRPFGFATQPSAPARAAVWRQGGWRAVMRQASCTLAGAFVLWVASATLFSGDNSAALVQAGAAAYRTFAAHAMRPVEMATADRGALNNWFMPQFARPAPVPNLAAAGLTLLGGRIVPGAFSPAQFMLYENSRRERFGLQIEPLDSPPTTEVAIGACGGASCASWTGAGYSFLILGDDSRAEIAKLAQLVRRSQLAN